MDGNKPKKLTQISTLWWLEQLYASTAYFSVKKQSRCRHEPSSLSYYGIFVWKGLYRCWSRVSAIFLSWKGSVNWAYNTAVISVFTTFALGDDVYPWFTGIISFHTKHQFTHGTEHDSLEWWVCCCSYCEMFFWQTNVFFSSLSCRSFFELMLFFSKEEFVEKPLKDILDSFQVTATDPLPQSLVFLLTRHTFL